MAKAPARSEQWFTPWMSHRSPSPTSRSRKSSHYRSACALHPIATTPAARIDTKSTMKPVPEPAD